MNTVRFIFCIWFLTTWVLAIPVGLIMIDKFINWLNQ